ncbi:ABC transporter permease [Rhodococcus tukisamuensis]|uniref:ABC-2 family transporter protein n=1 Tax=Rhodococcus tukisamuensis TaxID=168276 RepID=A0A1G6SWS4_9NOCA|nr:ABC transporter permease [Rhodococcus tukisamuensis]SDD21268.1 hypothetical protein SAMN05444580_103304 [Rhodococcus tukisamuensis]
MIWVTWRHHRTTILAAVGSVLLLTVVAALCGLVDRRFDGPTPYGTFFGCGVPGGGSKGCWAESTLTAISLITVFLPVLLGLLVGVTVFSRDIERGTHVLGLSQSVSRARWYWTRVLVVFVPVTAAVTVLGSVLEWTRSAGIAPNLAGGGYGGYSPLTFPVFQSTGLVAGAYTFLALILGSCAALVLRNTIGAMVVTLVAMSAVLIGFHVAARPHYATATVEVRPLDLSNQFLAYPQDTANLTSWLLDTGYVDAEGRAVAIDYSRCATVGSSAGWDQRPEETFAQYEIRRDALVVVEQREHADCLRAQGADRFEIRFHPDTLLQRFQLTEAALALALSVVLFVPSLWALRRLRP